MNKEQLAAVAIKRDAWLHEEIALQETLIAALKRMANGDKIEDVLAYDQRNADAPAPPAFPIQPRYYRYTLKPERPKAIPRQPCRPWTLDEAIGFLRTKPKLFWRNSPSFQVDYDSIGVRLGDESGWYLKLKSGKTLSPFAMSRECVYDGGKPCGRPHTSSNIKFDFIGSPTIRVHGDPEVSAADAKSIAEKIRREVARQRTAGSVDILKQMREVLGIEPKPVVKTTQDTYRKVETWRSYQAQEELKKLGPNGYFLDANNNLIRPLSVYEHDSGHWLYNLPGNKQATEWEVATWRKVDGTYCNNETPTPFVTSRALPWTKEEAKAHFHLQKSGLRFKRKTNRVPVRFVEFIELATSWRFVDERGARWTPEQVLATFIYNLGEKCGTVQKLRPLTSKEFQTISHERFTDETGQEVRPYKMLVNREDEKDWRVVLRPSTSRVYTPQDVMKWKLRGEHVGVWTK
jgi:hypothetical protein